MLVITEPCGAILCTDPFWSSSPRRKPSKAATLEDIRIAQIHAEALDPAGQPLQGVWPKADPWSKEGGLQVSLSLQGVQVHHSDA